MVSNEEYDLELYPIDRNRSLVKKLNVSGNGQQKISIENRNYFPCGSH